MATSKIWMLLSAFIGAGAALVTTVAVQGMEHHDQPTTGIRTVDTSKYTPTSKSVEAELSPGRLEALEHEVARLRGERNEPAHPPTTDVPDPQAERKRVEVRFAELERQLLADPVDPSWSRGAAESLRSDLNAIAVRDGFNLVTAECRTDMCRATLRWANYAAAQKTGMRLLERAIPGLNCVKSIWLKEPDDPATPYSSSLFLECSEQRAGTADTIPVTAMTTGERP